MKKKIRIALIALFCLVPLFVYSDALLKGLGLLSNPRALLDALQQTGGWGLALLVALLILQVFLAFIPGQALMVASGYLYGFWGGTLVTCLSLWAGGQAAFWLARRYGRPFAQRFTSPAVLDRWDRATAGQGVLFYTLALVLPVFPNDAMCYVAGLGAIQSRRFLVANLLGRLLASLATAFVGAYGASLPAWVWACLALLAGLGWLLARNKARFQKRNGGEPCLSMMQP